MWPTGRVRPSAGSDRSERHAVGLPARDCSATASRTTTCTTLLCTAESGFRAYGCGCSRMPRPACIVPCGLAVPRRARARARKPGTASEPSASFGGTTLTSRVGPCFGGPSTTSRGTKHVAPVTAEALDALREARSPIPLAGDASVLPAPRNPSALHGGRVGAGMVGQGRKAGGSGAEVRPGPALAAAEVRQRPDGSATEGALRAGRAEDGEDGSSVLSARG